MGFFDSIGSFIKKGVNSSTSYIKDVSGGIVKGITKGLGTARSVIDAGKVAVSGLSKIPVLGSALQVLQAPLAIADKAVENLQNVDKAANRLGADYSKGGFRNLGPAFQQYVGAVGGLVDLIPNAK